MSGPTNHAPAGRWLWALNALLGWQPGRPCSVWWPYASSYRHPAPAGHLLNVRPSERWKGES